MGSLIAYFHKHFKTNERKFKASIRMKKEIERFSRKTKNQPMDKCDKCEKYFEKGTLLQDDISTLHFCSQCADAIKILRDAR